MRRTQAQIRSEQRADILLIVGGAAASALPVLLVGGRGSEWKQSPRQP